jgi:tetratricopeptide (TPR) repeat protein
VADTPIFRPKAVALALLLAGVAAMAPGHAAGVAGPYLAAMQADFRNDYQAAADQYARALSRDPQNVALMQNALVARLAVGDFEGARSLAPDLLEAVPNNEAASLVLIAATLRDGEFEAARAQQGNPALTNNPLLRGLVAGWIEVGLENFTAAAEHFDSLTANDALAAYGQYHKALALALAGDFVAAEAIFSGTGDEPLHVDRDALIAHAEVLAQMGREEDAQALIDEALDGFPDMALINLRDRLAAGEDVPFSVVERPADGVAETFFTMATALNTEDADRFALMYVRLAQHIRPEMTKASLLAAEILERHGQYELASQALENVEPDSAWYVTAELRRANTQRAAGNPEAGIEALEALAEEHPERIEVHSALGDALRSAERYEEAAEAYGAAISLLGTPERPHWPLFYARAIAYERAGDWDEAEEDFRQALALEPEQPAVLNYLGYSLVEQRRNLDEALGMIERAVAGQPDDGYITDSLGWVLYRLERYEEALPHMLRAVELAPADAVINDHLGDVLWKVGREREARFQWRRALSFGPADDLDMDRIRRKLDVGLDAVLAEERAEERAGSSAAENGG